MSAAALMFGQPGWAGQTPPDMHPALPVGHQELADELRNAQSADGIMSGPAAIAAKDSVIVTFHAGSSRLTPSATRRLDSLGRALPEDGSVRIAAFPDGGGSREARRDLALRRAEAVASYLEMRGADREQLRLAAADITPAALDGKARVTVDLDGGGQPAR